MADQFSRQGVRYADAELLAYVDRLHTPADAALQATLRASEQAGLPAIQLGPSEAKLLGWLLRWVGARKVVEIGTLAGYSAIHMARGLPSDGKLWTVESDDQHAKVARANIQQAGLENRVRVELGAAGEVLPALEKQGPFDAVFVDADKASYPKYGDWAATHLKSGGLLIADNVYLFGRLMERTETAAAMRKFHEEAVRAFDTVCLPTPDGLLVGIRR